MKRRGGWGREEEIGGLMERHSTPNDSREQMMRG